MNAGKGGAILGSCMEHEIFLRTFGSSVLLATRPTDVYSRQARKMKNAATRLLLLVYYYLLCRISPFVLTPFLMSFLVLCLFIIIILRST
jgi:hypothetical protein